jgi:hypothetical protein
MQHFDVYVRRHRDGDMMLMIRNHNTCRALIKSPNHDYVEGVFDRVSRHVNRSTNKFMIVLRYYKVAKKRNLYEVPFI